MGGFNLPLFILLLGVAIVISVALSFWTDLSKLAVLVMSPLAACFGLFAFSQLIDFIERRTNKTISGEGETMDDRIPVAPKGILCPYCGAKNIAVILYGLPATTGKLEKAIEKKQVTLGGCGIYDGAPQWVCNSCHLKFG
jgi:hypothetical protein